MALASRLGPRGRYMITIGTSATGRNAYFVIVAWMGADLTHGPAFIAILLAVGSLAEFATTNIGGIIVDRFSRSLVCTICDLLRIAVMVGTIWGLYVFSPIAVMSISWPLYVVIDRTFQTTLQAMLPAFTPRPQLIRMNSLSYFVMQVGNFVAALVAGLLLVSVAGALALFLPLLCFVLSLCAMYRHKSAALPMTGDCRASLRPVPPVATLPRSLRIDAAVYAVTYAMGMLINVLASALVLSQPGGTALHFGYLESCWALGSIAGCAVLIFISARFQSQATLLLISGCALAVFFVIEDLRIGLLQITLVGITYNIARVLIDAKVQHLVPSSCLGRCRSQIHTICVALGILVYATVAVIGSHVRPATVFASFGVFMIFAGIAFMAIQRKEPVSSGVSET